MAQTIKPMLVTGAGGGVGSVSRIIIDLLRKQNLPVRAFLRRDDHRAQALRELGAEIVIGDLTQLADVHRAIAGCERIYFSISPIPEYLAVGINMTAVAKYYNVEVFVNMSQNPFFYHWSKSTVAKHNELRVPFASGHIPFIAANDAARVAAVILANPASYIGKSYYLTGPKVLDMNPVADAFSDALDRKIRFVPLNWDEWKATTTTGQASEHSWNPQLTDHLLYLTKYFQTNTDEVSPNVELLTGSPGGNFEQWVKQHDKEFNKSTELRSPCSSP